MELLKDGVHDAWTTLLRFLCLFAGKLLKLRQCFASSLDIKAVGIEF
jgi:hypothetical protein